VKVGNLASLVSSVETSIATLQEEESEGGLGDVDLVAL